MVLRDLKTVFKNIYDCIKSLKDHRLFWESSCKKPKNGFWNHCIGSVFYLIMAWKSIFVIPGKIVLYYLVYWRNVLVKISDERKLQYCSYNVVGIILVYPWCVRDLYIPLLDRSLCYQMEMGILRRRDVCLELHKEQGSNIRSTPLELPKKMRGYYK